VSTPATETPCARGCGRPAKPAGSRGFRSALCAPCTEETVREQTRERVRRHREKPRVRKQRTLTHEARRAIAESASRRRKTKR